MSSNLKTNTTDQWIEPSKWARLRVRIFGHAGFCIGATILTLMVVAAFIAPLIAPYDPYAQDLHNRLISPFWIGEANWAHPLGTDGLGRDYLSRLIYGSRISLFVGFATMVISGVIGTVLGLAAGYFGGKVDMVVNFLITTRLSMPVVLVAIAVVSVVGGSLEVVVAVLGLLLWDRFAVVLRSVTMQVRTMDYVSAAEAVGCSDWHIIRSEILPNVMNTLIVIATLEMALAILLESALSFLGLGVQPPLPSWGLMVAEARVQMIFRSWMINIPGAALFLLILAINLVGDGVRDITAPENRN